jgi:hypothetical protein
LTIYLRHWKHRRWRIELKENYVSTALSTDEREEKLSNVNPEVKWRLLIEFSYNKYPERKMGELIVLKEGQVSY